MTKDAGHERALQELQNVISLSQQPELNIEGVKVCLLILAQELKEIRLQLAQGENGGTF